MPKYRTGELLDISFLPLDASGIELDEIISDADRPSCTLRPRYPEEGVWACSGVWKVVKRVDCRHVKIRKIQDGKVFGRRQEVSARTLRKCWILEHPDDPKPFPVREWKPGEE